MFVPIQGDLLFVIADYDVLRPADSEIIDHWLTNGGIVVAGGHLPAFRWLLPAGTTVGQNLCEFPYAAIGWKFGEDTPDLIAPPLWSYGFLITSKDVLTCGQLVAIHGERQTPHRALVTPLKDAPAIIRHKNFIYLNGNPFAAFQSWLQGQEDLNPWLHWRHRLFWLDEQLAFLVQALNEHAQLPKKLLARPIAGLSETVVVLRHDLDHSRDTSYLDAEQAVGVPGVHAILRDNNTEFWVDVLRRASEHETAFHYTTATYNRWIEGARSKVGLAKRSYQPARNKIVGDGLLRQVKWAKKTGIGISTLHRHLSFLIYPEWIDAMHRVFQDIPETLGSSSLFRGQVLRWGVDRADGMRGTYCDFPNVQFPFWFPCKLAHAGLGGVPLKGWEATSLMEIEPDLFRQILDHVIPGIPQRIFTLNFHPAHALGTTFSKNGSFQSFEAILRLISERNIAVMTLQDVFNIINQSVLPMKH